MRFRKEISFELASCYAVGAVTVADGTRLLFAPDGPGPCYAVEPATGARETVWDGPGGTMAFVPLPGSDADFLAVQRFFPDYKAAEARLVRARRGPDGWQITPWLDLPYVHRFDVLSRHGRRFLVCATLCEKKEYKEDWRFPGAVLAAEMDGFDSPPTLVPVLEGLTRHHGYCRVSRDGGEAVVVSGEEGVFEIIPPDAPGRPWATRNILPRPVSDIAVCDIDGDDAEELAAIEPFHGDAFNVYKLRDGVYKTLYDASDQLFCHAIYGGRLRGEPVFIAGNRGGEREMFLLRWREGKILREVIETSGGPSNVCVLPGPDRDLLAVANRERDEAAVFSVADDRP
jgi:hypothetical protein